MPTKKCFTRQKCDLESARLARLVVSTKPSCKLHIYLANDAKKAVILRCGPTRWFHLILWHTHSDQFEFGSWFHGRIYEDRCDCSPDGRYFVYFAMTDSSNTAKPLGGHAWTAICRGSRHFTCRHETTLTEAVAALSHQAIRNFLDGWTTPFLPTDLRLTHREYFGYAPVITVAGADSEEIDYRNRLIYTRGGELWHCPNSRGTHKNPQLVADFTSLKPPSRSDKPHGISQPK